MSSDFTNIFIGANNSKRTKFNLIDNEKDPINSHSLSSILDAISRNIKEARSKLPLFKISVNPNQSLSAQLNEYDKKSQR
ncbi:hypothetical protein ACR9ME_02170 [Helicobacter pylori]